MYRVSSPYANFITATFRQGPSLQIIQIKDLLGTPDAPVSKIASVKTQRAVGLKNLKHFDTSISRFLNKITLLAP